MECLTSYPGELFMITSCSLGKGTKTEPDEGKIAG